MTDDPVTLPDEFVLLLHKPSGVHHAVQTDLLTAGAEVGELALRHHVALAAKSKLTVLDPRPVGIGWLDEQLAAFEKKAGPKNKTIDLASWLSWRSGRFRAHRDVLVRQGLLRHERRKALGFVPNNRYFPDELVRDSLISEVRQVAQVQRPIDSRLAMLCALVHAAGIGRALGCDKAELAMLKSIARGDGLGEAVKQALAAVTAVTAATIAATTAGGSGG